MYLTTDPFSPVMAFPANSTDSGTGKGLPTFTILSDRNGETLSGSSLTVYAGNSIPPQQRKSVGCIEKASHFNSLVMDFVSVTRKILYLWFVHTIQNPQHERI